MQCGRCKKSAGIVRMVPAAEAVAPAAWERNIAVNNLGGQCFL